MMDDLLTEAEAEAKEQIATAVRLLRVAVGAAEYCPFCAGPVGWRGGGHSADCEGEKFLKRFEE